MPARLGGSPGERFNQACLGSLGTAAQGNMTPRAAECGRARWPDEPFKAAAHALVCEALDRSVNSRAAVSLLLGMDEHWIENVTRHAGEGKMRELPAWALFRMIADDTIIGDDARFNLIAQIAAEGGYVVSRADAKPVSLGLAEQVLDIGSSVGRLMHEVRAAMADGRMLEAERMRVMEQARMAAAELAEALGARVLGGGSGGKALDAEERVLPGVPAVAMLRADLRRAGVDPINPTGLDVDFHSLRHTFVARLARRGVPAQVAQLLARHQDIGTTSRIYGQLGISDAVSGIAALGDSGGGASGGVTAGVPNGVPLCAANVPGWQRGRVSGA